MMTYFDELTLEIRILHVGSRKENKHESHEFVLRSLFQDLWCVSVRIQKPVPSVLPTGKDGEAEQRTLK